jgi:capsule polysaccharide export protein KpsE/RkpR
MDQLASIPVAVLPENVPPENVPPENWVVNARLLWEQRGLLARTAVIAFAVSLGIAFAIPKQYTASTSIMPPDEGGGGGALLAALSGRASGSLGGLGSLAGSLLGTHSTSSLFVDLLHSGTVSGHLIDRFDLMRVYHKRYKVDAGKYLARHTTIVDDKKTGVVTITVVDHDPRRARDLAQAYLDELNQIVARTATSSARQERLFLERRLASVQGDLERAQLELSDFSSTHATVDIKEQTRAMVDAAAKVQGQLIASQAELGSLRQVYGDGNVRVRAAQSSVDLLQGELQKLSGTDARLAPGGAGNPTQLYPPLRQLPRLAVPYADLYRRVKVQETVYELLTQEYELARIQEAKDIPAVQVIDAPGIPEKKSFPPRLIVALGLTFLCELAAAALLLMQKSWNGMSEGDPRKVLLRDMGRSLPLRWPSKPLKGDA